MRDFFGIRDLYLLFVGFFSKTLFGFELNQAFFFICNICNICNTHVCINYHHTYVLTWYWYDEINSLTSHQRMTISPFQVVRSYRTSCMRWTLHLPKYYRGAQSDHENYIIDEHSSFIVQVSKSWHFYAFSLYISEIVNHGLVNISDLRKMLEKVFY